SDTKRETKLTTKSTILPHRQAAPHGKATTTKSRIVGGDGKVVVKSYTSPTLVLLAYDWPAGDDQEDFLGFAIQRAPGFDVAQSSWLPNRIGFDGPKADQTDFPSNEAPIQKFYWWDARIDTKDRGHSFTYRIIPVTGKPSSLDLLDDQAAEIVVAVP